MPKKHKKKSKKKKKSKNKWYEWWIMPSFAIAIISILLYFTVSHQTALSAIILGQPRTPASKQQIDDLTTAITALQAAKINELTSKYEFNFDSPPHAPMAMTMNDFFTNWSANIHDNKYSQRLDIVRLLMNSTEIESLCFCHQLAEYRIIDALQLVLAEMSDEAIQQCFMQSGANNNNIFHRVSKSKAASFARQLLKLGANNQKLSSSFKRLHIFMTKQSKAQRRKRIVSQTNIKKWTSQIDIELIVEYALKANINERFFFATNSENYTGFDYWILNHGQDEMNGFLQRYQHLFGQYLEYNQHNKSVQNKVQFVSMEHVNHCNLSADTLGFCGSNACFPPIITDWSDFAVYWEQQRPVIIRAGDPKRNKNINLTSLMEQFGDLSMMVSEIPYAPLFGMKAWSIPIKEYMNVILNGEHRSNMYAFDKALIASNEELRAYFNYSVQFMHDKSVQYVETYQLALGPSTSGSPPHWHPPAFNQVFIGRKLWWMFSPRNSFFSSLNVMEWLNEEYKKKKKYRGAKRRHYCFVQQVGDVVFVPNEWSHATNNLQTTLAIAIEFS